MNSTITDPTTPRYESIPDVWKENLGDLSLVFEIWQEVFRSRRDIKSLKMNPKVDKLGRLYRQYRDSYFGEFNIVTATPDQLDMRCVNGEDDVIQIVGKAFGREERITVTLVQPVAKNRVDITGIECLKEDNPETPYSLKAWVENRTLVDQGGPHPSIRGLHYGDANIISLRLSEEPSEVLNGASKMR